MSEKSKKELKKQTDLADKNTDAILKTMALDKIVNMFDGEVVGLLKFMDLNMLSHRQVAKKILSYNTNPQLTDRELNLMLWGQDLEADNIYIFTDGEYVKQPNPGYTAYLTETEDMVYYGGDYEPMDIRQMIKDTINDLKKEIRREIRQIESGVKQMIDKVPKAVTQAINGMTAVVTPQIAIPPAPLFVANPFSAAHIALTLHNTSHLLNTILKDSLAAVHVLTSLNEITTGLVGSAIAEVTAPKVKTPAINGAPPIKVPVKVSVPPIPKIHFVLPDEVLIALYKYLINPLLQFLNVMAECIVALDAAVLALDLVALGPAGAILIGLKVVLGESVKLFTDQLANISSVATTTNNTENNANGDPEQATGAFASSINGTSNIVVEMKKQTVQLNELNTKYNSLNTPAGKIEFKTNYMVDTTKTDAEAETAYTNELSTENAKIKDLQKQIEDNQKRLDDLQSLKDRA